MPLKRQYLAADRIKEAGSSLHVHVWSTCSRKYRTWNGNRQTAHIVRTVNIIFCCCLLSPLFKTPVYYRSRRYDRKRGSAASGERLPDAAAAARPLRLSRLALRDHAQVLGRLGRESTNIPVSLRLLWRLLRVCRTQLLTAALVAAAVVVVASQAWRAFKCHRAAGVYVFKLLALWVQFALAGARYIASGRQLLLETMAWLYMYMKKRALPFHCLSSYVLYDLF